jgi:hypothetical protein
MKKPKRQRVELTAAVIDRSVLDRLEKALVIVAEGEMAKPTTKRLEKGVRKAVTCLRASLSLYGFEGGGGVDGEDDDKSKKRGGGKSRPPKQQQKQQAQAYAAGDEEGDYYC